MNVSYLLFLKENNFPSENKIIINIVVLNFPNAGIFFFLTIKVNLSIVLNVKVNAWNYGKMFLST